MWHLTLKTVLDQPSFGLRLVEPHSESALQRVVMGAHGTEILHPVPWLQRDWILMVTGVRLVDSPERQRELVAELAEGGLAALGFGVGIDFETIPEALVDEARRREFPVFEIPPRMPFREIIAFVNQSLLSDNLHTMRRLTSMREFLLDSFRQDDPQATIVQRLGSLLDSRVALFSGEGRLEARCGKVDSDRLWATVERGMEEGSSEVDLGDRSVLVQPVIDRDLPRSWLVLVRRRLASDTYTQPLVESAASLLSGLSGLRRTASALERANHAAFVADFLEDDNRADSALTYRAAALGLDLSTSVRGVMIGPHAGGSPELQTERALTEARRVLRAAGLPSVLSERGGEAAGFVQYPDEASLGAALEELEERLEGAALGLGRPVTAVGELKNTLVDAEHALRLARAQVSHGKVEVRRFEDFDLPTWLVSLPDRDAIREKASATLGELLEDEVLMDTLSTYLDHNLNVIQAAKQLALHPNSLRYRISRIEKMLDCSLQDPDAIAEIQLARRLLDP